VFNAVLLRQYFLPACKHAHVVSILKPCKHPTLPSYHRPISLLDTVGKLFKNIPLTRILGEVKERGLLCDEQFVFRPGLCTTLQLGHLVERVNTNFDGKTLTGEGVLDVSKAFNVVWVKGLSYKHTIPNFSSYMVKTISSHLRCWTFQTSFHTATSTRRTMWAGVSQGGLSPLCSSVSKYATCLHHSATSS
jgi:hypothetical protein